MSGLGRKYRRSKPFYYVSKDTEYPGNRILSVNQYFGMGKHMCKNAGIDTYLQGYGPKFAFLWAHDNSKDNQHAGLAVIKGRGLTCKLDAGAVRQDIAGELLDLCHGGADIDPRC